jgi:hypothetical protein
VIDASYGALNGNGPCARHDGSFTERWVHDSVDTGGSDYVYPQTRVVFIFGSDDRREGPPHGELLRRRLQQEGSPYV